AGNDINIVLPVNTANLDGSKSNDPDGTISTYAWTKTSGPALFNIANANAPVATISNLIQGVYVFTLQVTDNAGASSTSAVAITVNAAQAPVNQAPVANAGNDINIILPDNSTTLDGSASADTDGTITTYLWTETSGPATYSFANAAAATTVLSNLVQGVYIFNLQVTDNAGAISNSSVTVTVSAPPNKAPVANAGSPITITLPVNMATLDGSASYDPDGTITTYSWNKISGPGAVTIVNSNTSMPTVIGLAQGEYVFELTVTDNNGATATAQVIVTVNGIVYNGPTANAGKDTSVALPASSIVLSGVNSSDSTSTIVTYQWKEISGPSSAAILQPGSVTTEIDNLIEGDYIFELQVTDSAGLSSTADVKVSVINNFRYSEFFKLYPNPATSVINFQFIDDKTGKLGILVYDASGRILISEEYNKDQSLLTKQLNITTLKAGVYYLEIRHTDGTKLTRPFVKQ
ncbi:MAG TPA: PKD domain-containing protein, partial [Chitinophagaceae bacterium]|nr:PKD domain-containing protein [Chitinophagaceae bacterium]